MESRGSALFVVLLLTGAAVAILIAENRTPHLAIIRRLDRVTEVVPRIFVLAFTIVLTGTLVSTWRAAVTSPREAMR